LAQRLRSRIKKGVKFIAFKLKPKKQEAAAAPAKPEFDDEISF